LVSLPFRSSHSQADSKSMLNVQDATGRTTLIHAALQGRSDSVELLLAYGADPDVLDNHDKTALDYATDPTVRRMLRPASY
jgi:ankyrin repeat protein